MDDVSLKQKQADDKDLDNLIFDGEKNEAAAVKENQPQTQDGDSDSEDKKSTASAKADRSSMGNVLPVDKLKNGANTASKYAARSG